MDAFHPSDAFNDSLSTFLWENIKFASVRSDISSDIQYDLSVRNLTVVQLFSASTSWFSGFLTKQLATVILWWGREDFSDIINIPNYRIVLHFRERVKSEFCNVQDYIDSICNMYHHWQRYDQNFDWYTFRFLYISTFVFFFFLFGRRHTRLVLPKVNNIIQEGQRQNKIEIFLEFQF